MVRTTASLTQVLYLQEAGDPALISVNDIHQGQIGDCFLLSSIGELALWYPSAITNMIRVNADGTETVTLYVAASGALPSFGTTSFKAVSVTVDNTFPSNAVNNGASQDVLNGQKEIWVQVLEKAVATLNGGYNAIANGGYPVISMEELTGQAATSISPSSLTLQLLQSYMAAGDLIVMDTPSSGSLAYSLVNSHAYMFESLTMVGGTPMVQLGNPWGFYQPAAIPLSQLPWVIVEVDIGQFAASNNINGTAGNDTITLPTAVINAFIDLGAGSDTLILANGIRRALHVQRSRRHRLRRGRAVVDHALDGSAERVDDTRGRPVSRCPSSGLACRRRRSCVAAGSSSSISASSRAVGRGRQA